MVSVFFQLERWIGTLTVLQLLTRVELSSYTGWIADQHYGALATGVRPGKR